jgi:hypothetical protein
VGLVVERSLIPGQLLPEGDAELAEIEREHPGEIDPYACALTNDRHLLSW